MKFEKLNQLVLEWADNKGLIKRENAYRQALKMVSEVGETCDALAGNDMEELVDGIGDVLVTVIILAKQMDLDPVECLESAYNVIKGRQGKTVDGIFIKESEKVEQKETSMKKSPTLKRTVLKDLKEHNSTARTLYQRLTSNSPRPNGIACPKCGNELLDSNPRMTLTSNPPQKNTHCSACAYRGYRVI